MKKKLFFVKATFFFVLLASTLNCVENKDKNKTNDEITENQKPDLKGIEDAKMAFYSLPTPIEIAVLLKSTGTAYNDKFLHKTDKASNYNTVASRAVNLGIYTADLSYVSIFKKSQSMISYMAICKNLAEQLEISDAIDKNIIEDIEKNIENQNAVMNIISNMFMESNTYLNGHNKPEIASMVAVGGWIEGLYIALQLSDNSFEANKMLTNRIIDQKITMTPLINLLEAYKSNSDISLLLEDMKMIKSVYDKITVKTTGQSLETQNDVTVVKQSSYSNMNQEIFTELFNLVLKIRNKYV